MYVESFDGNEWVVLLGDLPVGNEAIEGIIERYGIPGKKLSGK